MLADTIAAYKAEAQALAEAVAAAGLPLPDTIDPFGSPDAMTKTQADASCVAYNHYILTHDAAPGAGKRRSSAASHDSGAEPLSGSGANGKRSKGATAAKAAVSASRRTSASSSSAAAPRAWRRCPDCGLSHWSDAPCPELATANGEAAASDDDRSAAGSLISIEKRWGGATTSNLLEALRASAAAHKDGHGHGHVGALARETQGTPFGKELVNKGYRIVNSKVGPMASGARRGPAGAASCTLPALPCRWYSPLLCTFHFTRFVHQIDITCGADGRYGITGNVTPGSMERMVKVLQEQCELDADATFIDLGHGMGRPNFHVALCDKPIKYR